MRLPGPVDIAIVGCAATVSVLLVVHDSMGPAEWVFGTVMLTLAAYVVRAAALAAARARGARNRAAVLTAREPDMVAREAIREERHRLADDIARELRDAMSGIVTEVANLDGDPRPALRRIHEATQRATSELRRHLGLLRTPDLEDERRPVPIDPHHIPLRDAALAAGLGLLAAIEVPVYLLTEGPRSWLPWSIVTSVLACCCVVGRTVAPGAAAATCGAVFAVATLVGYPVMGGFALIGMLSVLIWAVCVHGRARSLDPLGALLLVTAVVWSRWLDDPSNLRVTVVLMTGAMVAALAVRLARHREAVSRARATAREAELRLATRSAVTAERAGFARDLHDVVSHAVGLIALQAAAGLVSWPRDPYGVGRSLDLIDGTARSTLAELDRLIPGSQVRSRGMEDVEALVGRIRAGGTPVDLRVTGELPEGSTEIVYRVIQESLTNAARHAFGATVSVTVHSDASHVRVRIEDHGPGAHENTSHGYGLIGLTERVALVGGRLTTGPGPAGGFAVEAVLPARAGAVST